MDEVQLTGDDNPLRIVEDETPPKSLACDKRDDNESIGELFDFSVSDIEELESDGRELGIKRNSLLIVEEKDLMMDGAGDFNNNNNSNMHRLSLQVESGDENSLVMTNEAINRTIIRIGSNGSSVDFGESEEAVIDKPHEAINHDMNQSARRTSHSESFADDDGEVIVSILGQINDIVGCNESFYVSCFVSEKTLVAVVGIDLVMVSPFLLSFSGTNFYTCYHHLGLISVNH